MEHKKTAVGYVRCSTPKQIKGSSLERQFEACKMWCRDNNVELLKVVVDVGTGYDGFHIQERKAGKSGNLGRWLNSLVEGWDIPDYFVFEETDRLSRCPFAYVDIRSKLKNLDIDMITTGVYEELYFLTEEEKKLIYK